jgi:pectate lyase
VHVFNNYYLNVTGYGVASQMNAGVLVEGELLGERGEVSSGRGQEPLTFYSYTLDNPNGVPATVRAGAGVGRIQKWPGVGRI